MKQFKLTLTIRTSHNFKAENFCIFESDAIDGFEVSRHGDDITTNFFIKDAEISEVKEQLLYMVKLNIDNLAQKDQIVSGYLGNNRQIATYTRGEAIKKARMFGGKIEKA